MAEYIGEGAIETEPLDVENIGSLAQLMLPELRGCDDLMVRQQLGAALREFCRETDACTVSQMFGYKDGMPLPDGRGFHVSAVPPGMELLTVLGVCLCGTPLLFDMKDGPVPLVAVRRWMRRGDIVEVKFSVAPKVGGEDCPRWFKERYAEGIIAGAMFHMLSMTGRPWSDPQIAARYGGRYQQAIAEAAYRRLEGSVAESGPASAVPCGGLFM